MASHYGIVFPEFWTGPTGQAIRGGGKDAQILALYQMSCRHANMIGLYHLTLNDIRYETGLGMKGLIHAFTVLEAVGFSEYDAGTEYVWVREMAKFRLGLQRESLKHGDKRVLGINRLYAGLEKNPFLAPFYTRYEKELYLERRRSCGVEVIHLQDVAPSKGLTRALQGPYKPVIRSSGTEIRDQVQGSEISTAGIRKDLPPPQARRDARPVENSETDPSHVSQAHSLSTTLRDGPGDRRGGSGDRRFRVEGTHPRPAHPVGFRVPARSRDGQPGDDAGRTRDPEMLPIAAAAGVSEVGSAPEGPALGGTSQPSVRLEQSPGSDCPTPDEPAALTRLQAAIRKAARA